MGIQDSVIFTGIKNLITDATTALMVLAPILGALLIGFFFMKKSASEEMEQKTWQKRINTVIYAVIGTELASVIINLFISYFN
jgi:ABC-type Fe3+ transport system permease subunit